MFKDLLVEDVRRARRLIAARCNYDTEKLFLWLKEEEKKQKRVSRHYKTSRLLTKEQRLSK